jgi:Holliday junction resolvasome RuvABC endonuclease subunit
MERTKILAKALAQNEIKTQSERNNILTNDPSMTGWGWAVVTAQGKVLDSGCIKTASGGKKRRIRKGDETVHRVGEINQKLLEVIKKYHISYMLSELPHGSQNASAAVMIGVVVGIAQTLSDALGIGIEFYSEGDSKKCALGKRAAEKIEMVNCMKTHYEGWYKGTKYIDEAVADALAVHYVASKESSILKLYKTNNENGKI